MKKSILSPEERKRLKSAYDKEYRKRKKAGIVARPVSEVESVKEEKITAIKKAKKIKSTFEKVFDFPVRLYWNMRMEKETSSCAKAGTTLSFEEIKKKDKVIAYRVRRGKRNFFTLSSEIKKAE
jgi:hypothetical protein